jgi:PAS domain S-box-containing protein
VSATPETVERLRRENEDLRRRLAEAEDMIRAISGGEVDAFVITAGQAAEVQTLGTADRPYRLLVEAMGQGAATLGGDGTVLYANRRFADLLGAPLEKVVGGRLGAFVPDIDRLRFEALVRQCRPEGARAELTLRRGDGDSLPVTVAATALPEAASGVCLIVTDLTEQKRREEERVQLATSQTARAELERLVEERTAALKEAQQKALQAERLAAVGEMAAGLAHESRNALQRNQACLSVLALKLQDRPEELELLARMQQAQDDLHRLYEEVRGYASPVRLHAGPCRLAAVWREAWADLGPLCAQTGAELREGADAEAWDCAGDPFYLKQVFRNLLENAVAAGGQPPRVEVRCEPAELEGRPAVRVVLRDNGPGFAAESRQKLFEPFFTTKVRGTGLGLAICKRIVEAHGGRIEAGDGRAPGAEILLTLPRREA